MIIYITPDIIGLESGGGVVTENELLALRQLRQPIEVFCRIPQQPFPSDPFEQDEYFLHEVKQLHLEEREPPKLVHCYAGCLGRTIRYLQSFGTKVTYTVAAHDRIVSKQAHEIQGFAFPYRHLTEPEQWRQYIQGVLLSDLVIVPSSHSHAVMKREGYQGSMRIVPHGFTYEERKNQNPDRFVVGYLGVVGADKGLNVLLEAWKKLNYSYKEAMLLFAGQQTSSLEFVHRVLLHGGGDIHCQGWAYDKGAFFDRISLYVQPSYTEGFGITALEAMGHGKQVICSTGAGVSDLVSGHWRFPAGDVNYLASLIDRVKNSPPHDPQTQIEEAKKYTWDKIHERYLAIWKELI